MISENNNAVVPYLDPVTNLFPLISIKILSILKRRFHFQFRIETFQCFRRVIANKSGAGATFDWMFFDNSKLIEFDDKKVSFLRKKNLY